MNTLYLGDNLPILRDIADESVDLIYIDPPFNSNRNYSGIIKNPRETASNSTILAQFEDTWRGGMKTYIHEFMYPIVKELHRILKPTGSLYLHCDPTAQAYLQVEVLDPIFGISNFRNEIIWCYSGPSAVKNQFPRKHDVVFFYSKSNKHNFNPIFVEHKSGIHNKGTLHNKLEVTDESNLALRVKEKQGKILEDYWTDIGAGAHISTNERTGYPTQKPEKLLERIILASSNEGDTVFDCFMGSGTTIVVADKLKRNWIGIDQSAVSLAVAKSRLALNQDLFNTKSYSVITKKWDYDLLRKMDDLEFERLMVHKLGGTPSKNTKGGDMGIDGVINSRIIVQVKRSDGVGRNVVDNLMTATRRHLRDPKALGNAKDNHIIKINKGDIDLSEYDAILVAFSFGKGVYAEAVDMKIKDNFNILLLTVEDILPVARPPKVKINTEDRTATDGLWEFVATSQSKVENYSWTIKNADEIVASDLMSSENIFRKALKKGDYTIIVQVVDANGLSGQDDIVVSVA